MSSTSAQGGQHERRLWRILRHDRRPRWLGKSTTAQVLRQALIDRGCRVHLTTQPSHEQLGTIARYRTDTYRGQALACLVAADRYHHPATHIRYNVDAGKVVICDRYVPSSYVLQRMDGVLIQPADFRHVHTVHVNGSGPEPRLGLFFETQRWLGEPSNREPEKCSAVRWCPWHALPDDLIDYPAVGILGYVNGEAFSIHGWTPQDVPALT